MVKRKWALWEGKKQVCIIEAEYLRSPAIGVVELWNKDVEKEFLVAVIVLSSGQYISLFHTGIES